MDIKELEDKFREINKEYAGDNEVIHGEMDDALLEYVDCIDIKREFYKYKKWYS